MLAVVQADDVVGQVGGQSTTCTGSRRGSAIGEPAVGEGVADGRLLGQGEQVFGVPTLALQPRDHLGNEGNPFADALVDAALVGQFSFRVAGHVRTGDRGGDHPRGQGRVVQRPVADVEVERPHGHQHVEEVGPGAGGPVRGDDDGQTLLPRCDHLRGQRQGVGAGEVGVVAFQVGPEVPGEHPGQPLERGVVHAGLAFLEVADQQVAHRPGGDAVAVDEARDAALPDTQRLSQRGPLRQNPGPGQQHPRRTQAGSGVAVMGLVVGPESEDVLGGQILEVLAGVQHQLGDDRPGITPPTLAHRRLVGERVQPCDQCRVLVGEDLSVGLGLPPREEPQTRQDHTRHDQGAQALHGDLVHRPRVPGILPLPVSDPAGPIRVPAGCGPSVAPAFAGEGEEPVEYPGAAFEVAVAPVLALGPVRQLLDHHQDLVDRQGVMGSCEHAVHQLRMLPVVRAREPELLRRQDALHDRVPSPNSTARSAGR